MTTNTKEIGFEESIQQHLIDIRNYRKRLQSSYDVVSAMDVELLLEFVQASQPEAWEKLVAQHGEEAGTRLVKRVDEEITSRGLLDVLRNGVSDHGVKIDLAYFQPVSGLNPETQKLFEQNILSELRQFHYSAKDPDKSIDMALFLNGLPIVTVELKNQLSGQTVQHGIRQYRTDRDPKEKALSFKRCLAHFAIDTDLAFMTTKLDGLRTRFLPFNKGDHNATGNPANPNGYKTAYVWEDIFTRESLLEIIGQFMTIQVEEREGTDGRTHKIETQIFPRYHQLDTVRRLVDDAQTNGAGKNYLIQHSAGSGKSNTIAWTAHRMAELQGDQGKVFDSVIVVTDRRVLDRQLRGTVMQFAQTAGVVKPIIEGSKELKEALESGEKIIITTLQKFPVIVNTVESMPAKKFAVLVDEAHSSQTGESSKSLKQVLGDLDEAEREESQDSDTFEDEILRELRVRKGKTNSLSFFAFTATPKQKTLELFGVEDVVTKKFYPFSLYSMKQAIQEKFILDVLENYTTYQTYFALLKKVEDDPEFSKKKAQRLLIGYVDKHEHAIEKKVAIMVEHFASQIAKQIDGRAKAMIVTKSRLHAVRYKRVMDTYLREHGYDFKALVAFSGTVIDGGVEYTEGQMNGVSETQTAGEFKRDQYKFLIVAEKFQTGFDEPLLTAMYVDKKLSGVNAVQTLSRLNRTAYHKDHVFVLDFVNETDHIKEAFQPYYTATVLSEATDPNILHNLQRDILAFKMFSEQEVDDFCRLYFGEAKPGALNSFLDEIVRRLDTYLAEEAEDFRSKLTDYLRKYAFMSQIIPFEDTSLEKLYVFSRLLKKKLPVNKERLPFEVLESADVESYKATKLGTQKIELEDIEGALEPMGAKDRGQFEDERDALSAIIRDINERFGTDFSDDDRVVLNNLMNQRLRNNKALEGAILNNPTEAARIKFNHVVDDEFVRMLDSHFSLYQKLDRNPELKEYVKSRLFTHLKKTIEVAK